jgi:hypothetical protein
MPVEKFRSVIGQRSINSAIGTSVRPARGDRLNDERSPEQPTDVPIVPCEMRGLAWYYEPGPTLGRRLMQEFSAVAVTRIRLITTANSS